MLGRARPVKRTDKPTRVIPYAGPGLKRKHVDRSRYMPADCWAKGNR